ncbi:HNH endonuclease [Anabaena minutissima FACHB-250]|nr:HNH endonuclease [Anabaena minutissima FACHB-250]
MKNLDYYCQLFSQLNVSNSRKRGKAKHKPILILSVIDLIVQGLIKHNKISVSLELIQTFDKYWFTIGSHSYKGGLHYPFFHLKNEEFWHLGFKADLNGKRPKTINKLNEAVEYAYLDDELFLLLQDDLARQELIYALVTSFFDENRDDIEEIIKINQGFQDDVREDINPSENFDNNPKWTFKKTTIRNAFFRKAVVHIYDYKCAFCGLRVTKPLNQNIVDGAHIKPFAQFYDSRIHNGIALCKNHHWAFDRGWFTIDDKYKILISNALEEISPHAKPMKDFHGEQLLLPHKEEYFPSLESLRWHYQNIFQV